jgi:predicted MFS family arabinose efflux permease
MTALSTSEQTQPAPGLPRLLFIVMAPFALGYFLSYLFRSVNAVVGPDLVREFQLSAAQLGLVPAAYLCAFALFQLPLGLLLDRFGPRRVQAGLLCISAVGSMLFSQAFSHTGLVIASALIGLGFAGGLMASFKAVILWLPAERIALGNGCIMAFGGLGTVAATIPANWAAETFGWRPVFGGMAIIILAVAALIFFLVPERHDERPTTSILTQLRGLARACTSRQFWQVGPLVMFATGGNVAVQTLWAGPWLRDVGGLSRDGVAHGLFWIAVTFSIGILLTGIVADLLARRGIGFLATMIAGMVVNMVCMSFIILGYGGPFLIFWLIFSMTGQIGVLAYAHVSRVLGKELAGRSNTGLNFLMFATAFLGQAGIGWMLDHWPLTAIGGYDPAGYRAAFAILLALQLGALAWFYVMRPRNAAAAKP